jgi:phenylacetate-CoA ligase
MLAVLDEFHAQGVDPRQSSLKIAMCGAEPWTNAMRTEIEDAFDLHAIDNYGLSEIIGPGVSCECIESKDGPHIWEDHFYPEVIDPATGKVLPDGEVGELVFTTLTKEAMPIVRYPRAISRLLPHRPLDAEDGESYRSLRRYDDRAPVNVPKPDRGDHFSRTRGWRHFVIDCDAMNGSINHRCREARSDWMTVFTRMRPRSAHHIKASIGVTSAVRTVKPAPSNIQSGKAKKG